MSIEVRRVDGKIDEVVAERAFVQLEQMDDDLWHLTIVQSVNILGEPPNRVDISLFTKGHIRPRIEAIEQ